MEKGAKPVAACFTLGIKRPNYVSVFFINHSKHTGALFNGFCLLHLKKQTKILFKESVKVWTVAPWWAVQELHMGKNLGYEKSSML